MACADKGFNQAPAAAVNQSVSPPASVAPPTVAPLPLGGSGVGSIPVTPVDSGVILAPPPYPPQLPPPILGPMPLDDRNGRIEISDAAFREPIRTKYFDGDRFRTGKFVRGRCAGRAVYVDYHEVKKRKKSRNCYKTAGGIYFDAPKTFKKAYRKMF